MTPADKPDFGRLLVTAFRFVGQELTAEAAADWYDEFEGYPLAALAAAFRRHRRDSPYPPKPSDLYRHLDGGGADAGRPTPDEAWGLLRRFVDDEAETGVLSEEMREAWAVCHPVLATGDGVGARRAFIDAYARAVAAARERREPARWTVTLGADPRLREARLREAVAAGRLSADHVRALLPGPGAGSLEQVAGLLEGPGASDQERRTAERFRALAALLRRQSDEEARRREAEKARQREAEAARREVIDALVRQREAKAARREEAPKKRAAR
ncbi:MAG: hypothetical protein V9G18_13780 [Albidovulum sp.]